jgi:hypothetical protein
MVLNSAAIAERLAGPPFSTRAVQRATLEVAEPSDEVAALGWVGERDAGRDAAST